MLILFVLGCSETSKQNASDQISLPKAEDEKTTEGKDPGTKPLVIPETFQLSQNWKAPVQAQVESEQLQVPQSLNPPPLRLLRLNRKHQREKLLLTQLNSIVIEPENESLPYERSKVPHWDDEDGDGMNTRLEILFIEKVQNLGMVFPMGWRMV